MLRVGLTGGMGAGKSTVARLLSAHGAVVIDSDKVAREVVEPGTPGLAALVDEFGTGILLADGRLDRPALAARVFTDEAARAKLNAITHPLVGQRTAQLAADAPADSIVVQDIPLLVENGLGPLFNLVVVVDAPVAERVRRLVTHRQLAAADARARIAAQATDEQRRAAADVLLDNSGAGDALRESVHRLWTGRLVPFAANIRHGQRSLYSPDPVPANPAWLQQGHRLAARLRLVCGAHASAVTHVGATVAPGRAGPDVIELWVTVASQDAADALASVLPAAGFPAAAVDPGAFPAPPAMPYRIHASADPARPANVYLGPALANAS